MNDVRITRRNNDGDYSMKVEVAWITLQDAGTRTWAIPAFT
jgi:hypothetical protein